MSGSTSAGRSKCHNVVSGDRVPVRIILSSCVTSILSFVTVAVQPASHNCPTDNKLCVVISGTMCDSVAVGGNSGMFICPECVDVIVLPSGMLICNGVVDTVILTRLLVGVDRCVVHPVSMIVGTMLFEGGLKCGEIDNAVAIFLFSLLLLSSPPSHAFFSVTVFFPNFNSVLPSIRSNHVAVFWCPSLGAVHFALVWFGLVQPP